MVKYIIKLKFIVFGRENLQIPDIECGGCNFPQF